MKKLILEINLDGAAITENPFEELTRIFKQVERLLLNNVLEDIHERFLLDSNGNTTGEIKIKNTRNQ